MKTSDLSFGRHVYRSRGTLDGLGGLRLQYQCLGRLKGEEWGLYGVL